jgi:type IV secretory pathway VirB4 component
MAKFPDWAQFLSGDQLPVFRATSRHLAALYPLFPESGLIDPKTCNKVPGLWVGYCGLNRSGGVFSFDEYQLYRAGLLNNLNVIVLGEINMRKSSLIKSMIYRGIACGYNYLVTDFKGEYAPLAEAVGGKVLKFGPEARNFINPLDDRMDFTTRLELVASMAITVMGQDRTGLTVIERSLLEQAIKDALANPGRSLRGVATLPDVIEKLFRPTEEMANAMYRPKRELEQWGYEMALALKQLTEGELRGMFHETTSAGLFDDTPLLVMECKGVKDQAAAIITLMFNYFTQSQWGKSSGMGRFHRVIHDESWALAAYPAFVDSERRAFKLGRSQGVAHWIVVHHLNNLYRSGMNEAVKDLIADSDTRIIYRQDPTEVQQTAEELELSEAEVAQIVNLVPGKAIWKVGVLPGIEVEYVRWPEEAELTQTTNFES